MIIMIKVLVLCTGNSCRSIMAEMLINDLGQGTYKAVSAGSQPAGYVHPKSIETLERHGIAVTQSSSQSWDAYAGEKFDYIITVCDEAAKESCPVFLGEGKKLHWSTPDPAKVVGTEAQIEDAFDEAFGMLHARVTQLVAGTR